MPESSEHFGDTLWTNSSVLEFSGQRDPIEAVVDHARQVVLEAIQVGWHGPPFNPIELAAILGIRTVAQDDLLDARVVTRNDGLQIEFNPTRPRGRLRYSIAHEISHTFFPSVADRPRHRTALGALPAIGDDWQLELLCNIAAGELLVPTLALPEGELARATADINRLMKLRADFAVSTEAMLRRAVQVADNAVTMFAAAPKAPLDRSVLDFRIDYTARSSQWDAGVPRGRIIPSKVLGHCTAVGFTARGTEDWGTGAGSLAVQAVGIPPYPGHRLPRVAGVLLKDAPVKASSRFEVVVGDATRPRGSGPRVIAHIVNNAARAFGGGGFANQLGRAVRRSAATYRAWTIASPNNLALGNVHVVDLDDGITVASMVAQEGYGHSRSPRLRYVALTDCLNKVREAAKRRNATVHMPPIGTGSGRGVWKLVVAEIKRALCREGIEVTVYVPPGRHDEVLTGPETTTG